MIDITKTSNNLKTLRQTIGLSIKDLSEELNLSSQAIYKWERGESIPSVDRLIDLSELYGVPMDMLIVRR